MKGKTVKSTFFHLSPKSWLGKRLDSGRQEVVSPKEALVCECKPPKNEPIQEALQPSLERELSVISSLPTDGFALRTDRVETLRAKETGEPLRPSVDICIRAGKSLLLVECKYRAMPETQIVKSVKTFQNTVARKFDASQSFYANEGATRFFSDRIVLFNAASKDKVLNMFRRLQLEETDSPLRIYKIMDTEGFWSTHHERLIEE